MQKSEKGRYLLFRDTEHDYKSEYLIEDERYLLIDTLDYKGANFSTNIYGKDIAEMDVNSFINYNGGIIPILDLRGYTLTVNESKIGKYKIVVSKKGLIFLKAYKDDELIYSDFTGLVYYAEGIPGFTIHDTYFGINLVYSSNPLMYYVKNELLLSDDVDYNEDGDADLRCKYDDKKFLLKLKKRAMFNKDIGLLAKYLFPMQSYALHRNGDESEVFKKIVLNRDLYFTIEDCINKEEYTKMYWDYTRFDENLCKLHLDGVRELAENIYLFTCRERLSTNLVFQQFLYVEGRVYCIREGIFTWEKVFDYARENSLYYLSVEQEKDGSRCIDASVSHIKDTLNVLSYYLNGITPNEFLELIKYLPALCVLDDCAEYLKELLGRDVEFYMNPSELDRSRYKILGDARKTKEIPSEALEFIGSYNFPKLNGQE